MSAAKLDKRARETLNHFRQVYADMPNPFSDEYVQNEIAWYAAPLAYEKGTVKLIHRPLIGRCDDYLNVNMRIDREMVVPMFMIDGAVWMSLTPMEIQSASLAVYLASGVVATGGLGMGYAALKMAQSADVARVDVYEINDDVVRYFEANFALRDGYDKINIIRGDMRETMRDKDYDFVYIDVYADMLPDEIITDIDLLTSENLITEYWFWGIELVLHAALFEELIGSHDLPDVLKMYFVNWSTSKDAVLRSPYDADIDFVRDVINTLSSSGASQRVDLIIDD